MILFYVGCLSGFWAAAELTGGALICPAQADKFMGVYYSGIVEALLFVPSRFGVVQISTAVAMPSVSRTYGFADESIDCTRSIFYFRNPSVFSREESMRTRSNAQYVPSTLLLLYLVHVQ